MGHYDDCYAADEEEQCEKIRQGIVKRINKIKNSDYLSKIDNMIESFEHIQIAINVFRD